MKTGTVSKLSICLCETKTNHFHHLILDFEDGIYSAALSQFTPHLPINLISFLDIFLWKQIQHKLIIFAEILLFFLKNKPANQIFAQFGQTNMKPIIYA